MIVKISNRGHLESSLASAGDSLVVINFCATWCGPCKQVAPKLQQMASSTHRDVVFIKVDVDENPDIASQYGVSSMPTFIFIKSLKKVGQCVGANNLTSLINTLKGKTSSTTARASGSNSGRCSGSRHHHGCTRL